MSSDKKMTADNLIEAADIGVRRNGQWLLRHVSLAVNAGEIMTLIGPNGGGKTTLARVMLGLTKANEGQVKRRTNLKIGYVPQKLEIAPTLPLSVNRFMNLTRKHPGDVIANALEETGVAAYGNAQIHNLSGGEFQRVLLARAIAMKPDLLVLDEPVQGVDFNGEVALYKLIADIRTRYGCGILLISHDLHIVMAATDSVVCLNGHVCCSGVPEDVAVNPEFNRLFGSRGADAITLYQHSHDHDHDADGEIIHYHDHGEDNQADHDHAG